MSTPMRRIRSPCCARAASGHVAATQPTVMKSRRLMRPPRPGDSLPHRRGPLCITANWRASWSLRVNRDQTNRSCLPSDVRFTPKATSSLRTSETSRRAISGNHQWFNREVGSGSGQLFNPPNEPSDRPGTLRYLLAGATETPCRCAASIARPTRPEAFASSTNSAT